MQSRAVAAFLFVVVNVILGFVWHWQSGFVIAALASVNAVDAIARHRGRRWTDPLFSLMLDTTVIFFGMSLAQVPDSAVGIPYAYTILAALALLRPGPAIAVCVYGSVWFIVVIRELIPGGTIEFSAARTLSVGIVADVIFTFGFIGLITVMIQVINRDGQRGAQHVRMREAIALASNVLLGERGDAPLQTSLEALLTATHAASVFVAKNVQDPELGLCTSTIAEVFRAGVEPDPEDLWQLVPWSMLSGRSQLEAGHSFVLRLSDLEGDEASLYAKTAVRSELNIPVFVNGSWWGIVGFTDEHEGRAWGRRDEQLLVTAAEMVGAYIERSEARDALDRTIADLDLQVRYQHALAECAGALQATDDVTAVDAALGALLRGSDAHYAYIDENYLDPDLGLCARITADAELPTAGPAAGAVEWYGGPYSELPTSYAALSQGRAAHIRLSDLEGREREVYAEEGISSELCFPIMVGGEWRGSVAFASYGIERDWKPTEVKALHAGAQMIGTWWERTAAKRELEQLVASQEIRLRFEQAIAGCSQALVMSADEAAVDVAIEQLLAATGVDSVVVYRTLPDEGHDGPVAVASHQVGSRRASKIGHESTESSVQRIDYANLPSVRCSLERGKAITVDPQRLSGAAQQVNDEWRSLSELHIPIMGRRRWVGTIVFADFATARTWDPQQTALLQTVAEMIGAFWERNEARERLEELIRSKDEFVASVSHELRTPLTSVVGLAAELRDRRGEFSLEEIDGLIEIIAEQSTDVADIVNDLLVAARADIGTLVINLQPVSLRDMLTALTRAGLHARFHEFEIDGRDLFAMADSTRLRQILRNLIVNADRYGGSRLRATIRSTGSDVVLGIADDGEGVPRDRIDTIFEPYGRAHDAPTQPASVGLGLAVARQLARLMGGELAYRRQDGWTIFELTLPAAEQEESLDRARELIRTPID